MQSRPALGPDSDLVRGAFALLKKSERKKQELCLVEGLSSVLAAIESGACVHVLCTSEFETVDFGNTPRYLINARASAKVSDTKTAPGVYGVCRIPNHYPETLSRILILDEVSDPGNLGTIIRSAHAFDINAIFLLPKCADPWSGKVLRSSAGYSFLVQIIEISSAEDLPDVALYATVMEADIALAELVASGALSRPHGWIIGNESHGISPEIINRAGNTVRIEMSDVAESLNAAVVASICSYQSYLASRNV
jgi:TrmH family RNA methyltransferase